MFSTKLPQKSYRKRVTKIQEYLVQNQLSGLFVTNPYNIYYTTGLFHFPTERPLTIFIPQQDEPILFIPVMEIEEAQATGFQDIRHYFEFPGLVDPHEWMLEELKRSYPTLKKVIIDQAEQTLYARLVEQLSPVTLAVDSIVHELRLIKDSEEVELLKQAAIYSDFIVEAGKRIAAPGITEIELLQEMNNITLSKMIQELDEIIYVPGGPSGGLVPSGVRTAMPHALPSAKKLERGETLILSCGANVGGYRVECERTMFLEDVSKKQEEVFQVMATAQQLAIEAMRPGKTCAEVDAVALDYIRQAGYGQYLLHRTGHGKGLEEHEAPWIDAGDQSVLQPGMVLSSEPGIYIEGFSGFRHSDTIVVTEGEPLVLTQFPKSLEALIIKG